MKPLQSTKQRWTNFGLTILTLAMLGGCSTPLSKGWDAFEKDQFDAAGKEWSLAEKEEVKSLVKKAETAQKIVSLDQKAQAAEAKKKRHSSNQYRIYITLADKWPKDKWIDRSPTLKGIMDHSIEVVAQTRTAQQTAYDNAISCGKTQFKADEYHKAKACFNKAKKIQKSYKKLRIKTTDIEFMTVAVNLAIEIERQMEAERRAAEAAQRRFEAEQAAIMARQLREAEAKRLAAVARHKAEEAKRQAEELARLKIEQEKARVEAEKKRRWMAFLRKGRPLKPLVTTVGIPSIRKGKFSRIGQKIKFQAGAQFPILRKKGLKAEDLFALEISINRDDKATYLRNYSKSRGNLLQMPQTVSGRKHYYTEGYKGGRYYTEVENVRPSNNYEVKAVIYKIPVVH